MKYGFQNSKKSELIRNHLQLGGANPEGERIDVTSLYLERGGRPWIGVMGEYHFVRDNAEHWYEELCKMKAGGITVVATYLFWNYHEEIEGKFDYTKDKDIRRFVQEAGRAGLDAVIRIGPWAHGECRYGGFPDWLLKKPYRIRENNDEYLAKVRSWYESIYEQVKGLFYKDGGNIIAVQIENELVDNAEHLLTLKKLAQEIGLQAPLYTVTGWNSKFGAKIPVDEVLPVFGAYPEAPWAGHTERLPLSAHYVFQRMRNDSAIGEDLIGRADEDGWRLPYERYPYATCELGGGIQVTHHRRPIIRPMDVYALSLTKLGSGNNLVGYYMYHGGTNKLGSLTTLNESRATGYPNDYSILSYDFQAPISEYGEIREQYRLINMLHMFVNDFGDVLAPMELTESAGEAVSPEDMESLRYAMRTDGRGGFVFVNHYQRLAELKPVDNVVLKMGETVFPEINVRGEISFFLPFGMDMSGLLLETATAQPLGRVDNTYFFVAIEGIAPQYRFADGRHFEVEAGFNKVLCTDDIKIVTLTWQEARFARKLGGCMYLGEECDLYETKKGICSVEEGDFVYHRWNGEGWECLRQNGERRQVTVTVEEVKKPPFVPEYEEELQLGGRRELTWKKIIVSGEEGFIEIADACDAAQLYADGRLVADNFYYGRPWRIPAKLLWGKECFLVMSEMKDDFYREF